MSSTCVVGLPSRRKDKFLVFLEPNNGSQPRYTPPISTIDNESDLYIVGYHLLSQGMASFAAVSAWFGFLIVDFDLSAMAAASTTYLSIPSLPEVFLASQEALNQ